jgi:glycosyltransferase involved in cell wall biosynthesis
MKVCFFGIYDPTYSRNSILIKGLRENGAEVIECREEWRDPRRYRKLIRRFRALKGGFDIVYAAYPSSVPAILAKLLTRKPVAIDAFYSNFDSVVNDRKKYRWYDPRALKALLLDWLGVLCADLIITDTKAHAAYWSGWLGVRGAKIRTVYLGMDEAVDRPLPHQPAPGRFLVHFHGFYIPLQGATKIAEAAALLENYPEIYFHLMGEGRDYPKVERILRERAVTSVELLPPFPPDRRAATIAEADVALGIFGDTDKARRVIPNKVYECLASRKPVITMDTPAARELFGDEDVVYVAGDPQSIADATVRLVADPALRARYAEHGYATVLRYRPAEIGRELLEAVSSMPAFARFARHV